MRDILWAKDCTVQMRKVPVCVCVISLLLLLLLRENIKKETERKEITNNCPHKKKIKLPAADGCAEMKEKTVHLPPASGPFSFYY